MELKFDSGLRVIGEYLSKIDSILRVKLSISLSGTQLLSSKLPHFFFKWSYFQPECYSFFFFVRSLILFVMFQIYKRAARNHRSRNFVLSSFNIISLLSMLSLGARGPTANALANLLRIDEFRHFNPHLLLKNIQSEVLQASRNNNIAFATQMFVEEVSKKLLPSFCFKSLNLIIFALTLS